MKEDPVKTAIEIDTNSPIAQLRNPERSAAVDT
jgi:hypothetical protein